MKKFLLVTVLVMMTTVFCFMSACNTISTSSHNEEGNVENSISTNEEPEVVEPKNQTPTPEVYGPMSLNDAYDYGYLTQEDLLSIAYYYQSYRSPELDEPFQNGLHVFLRKPRWIQTPLDTNPNRNKALLEGFVPKKSEMETLSEELKKEIEAVISNDAGKEAFISGYWGTFNNCVIVWYSYDEPHFCDFNNDTYANIGGVEICIAVFDTAENLIAYRLHKDN